MPKVAIVMGSKNDYPVVKKAADLLKELGILTVVRVLSAHRTRTKPKRLPKTPWKKA